MRQIEKPELISTIRDKKKVWLNIRESRLMYMFHRKLISIEEYEAGSRYRLMCELMGGGTGNVMKERIDGSSTDFITSSLGAALAVKDCDEEIGKLISETMKLFCNSFYAMKVQIFTEFNQLCDLHTNPLLFKSSGVTSRLKDLTWLANGRKVR